MESLTSRTNYALDYAFLRKYKLDEPELRYLALIVRGADTDRHDPRPKVVAYSQSPWVFLTSTPVTTTPCYGTGLSFMMPCIAGSNFAGARSISGFHLSQNRAAAS